MIFYLCFIDNSTVYSEIMCAWFNVGWSFIFCFSDNSNTYRLCYMKFRFVLMQLLSRKDYIS